MTKLRLRCYAECEPTGWWYVHCIDLTLDALASTYDEARAKLDKAVTMYIDWVLEEARTPKQVLRPSPLEIRLRYWRKALRERARTALGQVRPRSRRPADPARIFMLTYQAEFTRPAA